MTTKNTQKMEVIVPRIFNPPQGSYFLFGPRGTGKSTWLKEHYVEALWIDLLNPEHLRRYTTHPEYLIELVRGNPSVPAVVIDEVQKVPQLLEVVHMLIEERPSIQFVLTGSSARKLRRAGVDLLAGRAAVCSFHPFLAAELGNRFDLDLALRQGLVPLVWSAADAERALDAYVSLYVQEEVRVEGLVRNVGDFGRFMEAVSFSHGSVLNVSNVARESGVGRKTVEQYVSILEDLLVAYRIPSFTRRARRAVVAHPKFYFFDAGVYQAIRPRGPLDSDSEVRGAALEGLVAQHLIAYHSARGFRNAVHYWRTRTGAEVDFVCYGEEVFWAIEVKHSTMLHEHDLKHMRALCGEYKNVQAIVLYRGTDCIMKDGVLCVPCDDFLRALVPTQTPADVLAGFLGAQ